MESIFLEISLISAQGMRPPPGRRHLQAYALIWVDPEIKLRTLVDRDGGPNPTWNDKFLFRVPRSYLADDSPSAVSIEFYASGCRYIPDSVIGSVRLLVGTLRLLSRRPGCAAFDAVGIRRPSGRIQGVLNVAAAVLGSVCVVAARALELRPAVGYRELMEVPPKNRRRRRGDGGPVLRELNQVSAAEEGSPAATCCGPCVLDFSRSARHPDGDSTASEDQNLPPATS